MKGPLLFALIPRVLLLYLLWAGCEPSFPRALYWSFMRPTILPNPGQLPRTRLPGRTQWFLALPGGVGESPTPYRSQLRSEENELLRQDAGSAFASAQDAVTGDGALGFDDARQQRSPA